MAMKSKSKSGGGYRATKLTGTSPAPHKPIPPGYKPPKGGGPKPPSMPKPKGGLMGTFKPKPKPAAKGVNKRK